jgi:UrcA family protein
MVDRLILANGAVLAATVMATLTSPHAGAPGARVVGAPAAVVEQRPAPAPILRPELGIRLHDVDLAAPGGPQSLLLRIRHAARTLCVAARLTDPRAEEECVRETTDRAVAELCNPGVAAANAADSRSRD